MTVSREFRLFISAVSGELKSYRKQVARVLRSKGLEVRDEEHFSQGSATLLERLAEYIKSCDAVILLVGQYAGAFPHEDHASVLNDVPLFSQYCTESGQASASYSQWEFLLAKHFGTLTYTFFAGDKFKPDNENTETAERLASQAAYRAWIDRKGEHREEFDTPAELIERVLLLPFPDLNRPKPIVLPYPSIGSLFKGRGDFLKRLRESLSRGNKAAIVSQALHGLGGIGKTRTAVEYAWTHAENYTALLSVVADTPEALRRNLAGLCSVLVPNLDAKEDGARLQATLDWLNANPGWFLILDNIDTPVVMAEAERLLRELAGGHVVITGRLATFSGNIEPLELDVLAVNDAAEFLLERTNGRRRVALDDETVARQIAVELGQLALALEQASAYVARHRMTFSQYLDEWRANREKVLAWFHETITGYPRAVAVTWQTTIDQVSAGARRLLERLAWLAPERVPEFLLDVPIPGAKAEDLRAKLTELADYSLVARDTRASFFLVHRLVQDVTRRNVSGATALRGLLGRVMQLLSRCMRGAPRGTLAEALAWINVAFPTEAYDIRNWPRIEPLAAHAHAILEHADAAAILVPTARLMNVLAVFLDAKALYQEAEPLKRRALAIAEQICGKDDPEIAVHLNNLATLLLATNRLGEAEPLLRRALTIAEQSYAADHPDVASHLNNLAQLLKTANRLDEAEPLMRRALAINEQRYGKDNPRVAVCLNNLARLLHAADRLSEAEPLIRRALAIDEQSAGKDFSNVAKSLNNLAQLLHATNRLGEAEPLVRRALEINEQSYGKDHPEVARDLNELARLLHDTNRLREAELLLRRALVINEQRFGKDDPKVGVNLNNLGRLLQDANRLSEAESMLRRSIAIFEDFTRQTGYPHPHLDVARHNYSTVLSAMGHGEFAKPKPSMRDPADPATWGKVGRNEPCLCGSGKRYKHCHGIST